MIEVGGRPRVGRVTGAALTVEMRIGLVVGVTCLAIRKAGVIERRRLPGRGRVTLTTLTRKVIGRLIGCVA